MRSSTTDKFLIAAKRAGIFSLEQVAASCEVATAVSELVHCLQRERGASAIYLASEKKLFASQVSQFVANRQTSENCFRDLLDQKQNMLISSPGGMRLLNAIALSLEELDGLAAVRTKIDNQSITVSDSNNVFSRLISSLLSIVFQAADIAGDPKVTRILVALFNLMQGKEYAGLERAWAATGFASGQFDKNVSEHVRQLLEAQRHSFEIFTNFAPETVAERWRELEDSDSVQKLQQLRGVVARLNETDSIASELSEVWYELASARIDQMRPLEISLTSELKTVCQTRVEEEQRALQAHQKRLEVLSASPVSSPSLLTPLLGHEEGDDNGVAIAIEHYHRPELARSVYDLVCGQAKHIQKMTEELEIARAALADRKLVERAKGLLMKGAKLTEEQAHRRLQQYAMKENKKMSEVASDLIAQCEK